MKELAIRHVDVFTSRAFAGNPLLVVLQADSLSDDEMQSIAREFEMPETTFVLASAKPGADYKIRIFTPITEIPFAGHPVIGTAHVVVTEGIVKTKRPRSTLMHETNVGLLPLEVIEDDEPAPKIIMTLTKPNILSSLNESQISSLAEALKIEKQMVSRVASPQIISTGLAQLFVRMDDLENVKALTPDLEKLKRLEEKLRITGVAVFTLNTVSDEVSAHLRFFAPSIGITEDAAAGSAAGGLGAYLAITKALPESKLIDFSIEQGLELGRPSRLYVSVLTRNGYPEAVKVGGYSTTLLSGTLKLQGDD